MTGAILLSKIPIFLSFKPDELEGLAKLLREQRVEKGDVIFRKNSEGNALYFIKTGAVKIILPSVLGDERIVTVFSKGDFFGEMALLDGMPRSADAIAVEPSRLLVLNRNDFLRFLKNNGAVMVNLLSALSMRLRKTDELLRDTSFLSIRARFAKKLLALGEKFGLADGETVEIKATFSQKELADMVGATRESINKELRILREKGLIRLTENSIIICDINRLRRRMH
jgi:CRP-like cAMP-binding protein